MILKTMLITFKMAKWFYILAFINFLIFSVFAESESSTSSFAESFASSSSSSYSECENDFKVDDNCGKNEVYDKCPAPCPPRRCDVDERVIRCAAPPKLGDPDCEPGCRCADNFYKNNKNVCVPKNECPKCDKNEVYDVCPAPCPPRRCDVDERLIKCAAPPQPGDPDCKPGCRCADNYYRNDKNVCVTKNQCPPKPNVTCGADEVYSSCVNGGCGKWNCSETAIKCVKLKEGACREGCHCKENYLRLDNGTCVPADECPPNCGENEVYDICPAPCPPRRCDVDERLIKCAAPPQPGDPDCKPGCRCADNYYRNDKDVCVTKNQCPPKPNVTCGADEVYSSCVNGGCGKWNCSETAIKCVKLKEGACREGCHCKENYLRLDNGTCVPADECPPNCGENEVYDICPAPCPPRRCDVDERLIRCAAPPQPGDPDCKPGCRCADNYYKNDQNVCVTKNQCPCKDNEVYDICPAKCPPQECGVDPAVILCLPNPQPGDPECEPGCRCVDNFYKTDFGDCIPKNLCPNVTTSSDTT